MQSSLSKSTSRRKRQRAQQQEFNIKDALLSWAVRTACPVRQSAAWCAAVARRADAPTKRRSLEGASATGSAGIQNTPGPGPGQARGRRTARAIADRTRTEHSLRVAMRRRGAEKKCDGEDVRRRCRSAGRWQFFPQFQDGCRRQLNLFFFLHQPTFIEAAI